MLDGGAQQLHKVFLPIFRFAFQSVAVQRVHQCAVHQVILLLVLFSLALAFSKWGSVRLGKDGEKPEYSTISWFAMLFGTGMGIGLVFWSVAEPLSHYIAPMAGVEAGTPEAAAFAVW